MLIFWRHLKSVRMPNFPIIDFLKVIFISECFNSINYLLCKHEREYNMYNEAVIGKNIS